MQLCVIDAIIEVTTGYSENRLNRYFTEFGSGMEDRDKMEFPKGAEIAINR